MDKEEKDTRIAKCAEMSNNGGYRCNADKTAPRDGACYDDRDGIKQAKVTERFVRKLNRIPDPHVSGGPFHYLMRAGTYGEAYDEPPWRVNLGIAEIKERSGLEANPMKCRYENRVLLNNWFEERRDRQHIKYDNAPKLSEYGHVYKSEYTHAYSRKKLCNKPRDVLLKIKSFPQTAHPGHQPDLDIPVLTLSAPKPEGCICDEEVSKQRRAAEIEKRYIRYANEMGTSVPQDTSGQVQTIHLKF